MPYLVLPEFAIRDDSGVGTSFTISNQDIPAHAANDILVAVLNADGANQPSLPTSTGGGTWVSRHNNTGTGHASRVATLIATSANETCSWTLSASDTSGGWVGVVKSNGGTLDYDTSTVRSADDSTEPFAGIAITPAAKTLLLQFLTSDGGMGPICQPGPVNVIGFDTGADSIGVAYQYRKASASVSARNWYSGVANDNTMAYAISFDDDGSEDVVNGYLDDTTVASLLWTGGISTKNNWTWDVTTAYTITLFGGRDFAEVWAYDGVSAYTDETTDAADTGTADVTRANTVGAIWYFGLDLPFDSVAIAVSTARSAGTTVWEYWDGSTWTTLTVSGVMTATGNVKLTFTRPSDWAATTVNGGASLYFIRERLTVVHTTSPILSVAYAGGIISSTFDAPAAVADAHMNPYSNATNTTGAQSTALSFVGMSADISSAVDMSAGLFMFHHKSVTGRDYAVDPCRGRQLVPATYIDRRGGIIAILVDSGGNYEGYVFHSKGSLSANNYDWNTAVVAINDGAEPFLRHGTLNTADIRAVYFVVQPEFGACQFLTCNYLMISNIVVAGGGQAGGGANPMLFDEFVRVVNNGMSYSRVLVTLGTTAFANAPIQYGGGDAINLDLQGATIQLPEQFDGDEQHTYNGPDDMLNQVFYLTSSSDYLNFDGSIWNTGQPHIWGFHASHSAAGNFSAVGAKVQGPWNVVLRANAGGHVDGVTFDSNNSFDLNSCAIDSATFIDTPITADTPADAEDLTNCTFRLTAGLTQHGLIVTGTAADIDLVGAQFEGFAVSNGSVGDEAIYVNIGSGTVNINVSGGGSTPSIRTAGATVNVVNARTVRVTARDADTSSVVESARVALWATTGTTVTITRSGSTASVAHTAHGYSNGQKVAIFGADQGEYNGLKTISNVSTDAYDYSVSGTPTTPATGTILSHRVILDGDTSAGGIVEDTAFPYTSDLDVTGRVRKGTSAPRYKTAPVSGTITSAAGFDSTAYLVSDA